MKPTLTRRGQTLALATVLLAGLGIALRITADVDAPPDQLVYEVPFFVGMLAFVAVGVLVTARLPRHPVGWLFLAEGFLWILTGALASYLLHTLPDRAPAPPPGRWRGCG